MSGDPIETLHTLIVRAALDDPWSTTGLDRYRELIRDSHDALARLEALRDAAAEVVNDCWVDPIRVEELEAALALIEGTCEIWLTNDYWPDGLTAEDVKKAADARAIVIRDFARSALSENQSAPTHGDKP